MRALTPESHGLTSVYLTKVFKRTCTKVDVLSRRLSRHLAAARRFRSRRTRLLSSSRAPPDG